MIDPFTFYSRMMSAAFEMAGTFQRASETLAASQSVVTRRTAIMGDAARSPMQGDYAELSRMVPEKLDAFGKAGAAMASDWWAMQSAFLVQAQQMGAMAMKGRAPTLAEVAELSSRNMALALRTFERSGSMGANGLRPIHASATSNARRLARKAA